MGRVPARAPLVIRSLVLVHGAGSGPWVFGGWAEGFPGIEVAAVDLQRGLDVARAGTDDYVDALVRAADVLPRPLALCGWSMGGLVALAAAAPVRPERVVLLEPSPPAEAQGRDESVVPRDGAFDPEAVYGPFPPGMRARPESQRARDERKRGISVRSLGCPSLVACGDEFPEERGERVARLYGSDLRRFPGLDHWQLVLRPEVRAAVAEWLGA